MIDLLLWAAGVSGGSGGADAGRSDEGGGSPLWLLILIGMSSGVIGAVVGPIVQRTFARNDRALEARQAWAKEKLQSVFGIGDERFSSDGPRLPFFRLVPPHSGVAHYYDMHQINAALEESTDLMLLQPNRSAWARQWLYDWHFRLQPEAKALHIWTHYNDERFRWNMGRITDTETGESGPSDEGTPVYDRYRAADQARWDAEEAYQRRVRKVQSSLAIWATGQWLARPSLWHWVVTRQPISQRLMRHPRIERVAPEAVSNHTANVTCTCVEDAFRALDEMRRAERAWQASQRSDSESPATAADRDA